MEELTFSIIPYEPRYQSEINSMMDGIAEEFDEAIMTGEINPETNIPKNYWLAIVDGKVVGTTAVVPIGKESVVLKRMMLAKSFRGYGVAAALLDMAMGWSKENGFRQVFLGTMDQFKAAQRFYEKNGFVRMDKDDLPLSFVNNPLDTVFFHAKI